MGFKLVLAGAAAFASVLTCNAAFAATTVEEFGRICLPIKTAEDATANARAAGFVAAPADMRARLTGFPTNGEVLWKPAEGEIIMVITAQMERAATGLMPGPVSAELCAVASMPGQADLAEKLEKLMAVGAQQTMGATKAYVYEDAASGRVGLNTNDKALMQQKLLAGTARMVSSREGKGQNAAMLMIPVVKVE